MAKKCAVFKIKTAAVITFLIFQASLSRTSEAVNDSGGAHPIRINSISIEVHDIYDRIGSERLRFLYTWANRLHIVTNENVVRRELLFKEGDVYDPALVAESERILRGYSYFRKVNVRVSEPRENLVDLVVETHDVWTTEIQADWGTTAGQTNWLIGFEELNLGGQGQSLKASYRQNLDEKIKVFSFRDPRLLNTHADLKTGFSSGEKSESWHFHLNRPFYATITRWTAGLGMGSSKEERELLTLGERTSNFDVNRRTASVYTGYAFTATRSQRSALTLAGSIDDTRFSNIETSNYAASPADRVLKGATLSYSFERMNFIKETHITKFDRDEDFFLGPQHIISCGMFPKKFGSTEEEKVLEYYFSRGLSISPGQFALLNIYSKNLFREHLARTSKQAVSTQYYNRISIAHTLAANLEFIKLINPDNDRELLLGSETGLRGYSVREFSGNKKLFFSLEDRVFLKDDLWKLISVGGVLFFDSGMIWREDEPVNLREIRNDIGIGFRFGLTRSSASEVIRIDLAYALNKTTADTRWVLTVKSGQIFKPKNIDDFRTAR